MGRAGTGEEREEGKRNVVREGAATKKNPNRARAGGADTLWGRAQRLLLGRCVGPREGKGTSQESSVQGQGSTTTDGIHGHGYFPSEPPRQSSTIYQQGNS